MKVIELKALAYRCDVLGHPWTVWFYTKKAFKKKYDNETYGVAELDDREIFLRVDRLGRETLIHELVHAHVWEMGAAVAGLDADQMEEVACELIAKYGERIFKIADEVLLAYKILRARADSS